MYETLAAYQDCRARIKSEWPAFERRRVQHFEQEARFGAVPERTTELIITDVLTRVLDWSPADLNYQLRYADIVVSRVGLKALLLETKRPRSLTWNENAVREALCQAWHYARAQKVAVVAISDAVMLYGEEWPSGSPVPVGRVLVDLSGSDPPLDLWWLSLEGIYRARPADAAPVRLPRPTVLPDRNDGGIPAEIRHPKYDLPCRCFGYVGDPNDPGTWHLPYLLASGDVDSRRLPKAVQAIVSNHRGAHVKSIPDVAIPAVLTRLVESCVPGQVARLLRHQAESG